MNDPKLEIAFPNKPLTLQATFYDLKNNPISPRPLALDWSIVTGADAVKLSQNDNLNQATITAIKQVTAITPVKIKVCLRGSTTTCDEITATILVPNDITNFRPLKIRLDMLDDRTAKDLFGRKAVDDYFIAKVRLFNKIKKGDEDFGNSILVYSESLEVTVAVEYRVNDGVWETLTIGKAEQWFPNARITNDEQSDEEKKSCERIKQKDFFVPYRPLTFEMVANTQDRRDERSTRSRLLLTMNGLASLTSFITAIAVPGANSDLPLGLDKFKNLLIPSFEKLFPSLNEVQRQNIISMVIRPLEEIPFGSDITRIVFFPKKRIKGVLSNQPGAKNTELRISAVSISDACAEAAIIKKTP